ncbi:diaminopimelate decarboxylase [Helicobacter sp. 16-1353]|nr:diaminopimelate decarboxylase [Helicobacter sp. 16-1353]
MTKDLLLYLANKYGTPLYVYDFDEIKNKVFDFKRAFKARKSLICYALKANSNLSLLSYLASLDCGADCVSINEVKRALKAGIPKYKIIYSGVGKSDLDIKEALELDILFLNLESVEEMLRVETIAKDLGKSARISIRVNPNVDAKTHPYISTGLRENKFGVNIESAKKMYIYAGNSKFLHPIGIHFHIGSQLVELSPITQSANKIVELIFGLLALKLDLKFIDIGGGIGIKYNDEKTIDIYSYAQGILKEMQGLDLSIICEPGRYIVGDCGVLISKILYEKQNENKRFCIVDAAMNDLIRPALYNAKHKIEYISVDTNQKSHIPDLLKDNTRFQEYADIVGPICESGDYIAKHIKIPRTKAGDLIIIKSAGAYGFSMSSNYNSRLKCAEVAIINGKDKLIRKRENFEDLIANELPYLN